MPLFLITSLYDEGLSPNTMRVVEAESDLAIAAHILHHPDRWGYFLRRSFGEDLPLETLTPETLLERINSSSIDGDSIAQLRITPITVQPLDKVTTGPRLQPGTLFSDFG